MIAIYDPKQLIVDAIAHLLKTGDNRTTIELNPIQSDVDLLDMQQMAVGIIRALKLPRWHVSALNGLRRLEITIDAPPSRDEALKATAMLLGMVDDVMRRNGDGELAVMQYRGCGVFKLIQDALEPVKRYIEAQP